MHCEKHDFLWSNCPSIIDEHLQIRDILESVTLDDISKMPFDALLTLLLECNYSLDLVQWLSKSNEESKYKFKNFIWANLFTRPHVAKIWEGTWLELPSL